MRLVSLWILVVVVVIAGSVVLWNVFPGETIRQILPAWVQAVASILAIVAAFMVGNQQAQAAIAAAAKARSLEESSRRKSILAIAEAAAEHARRFDAVFPNEDDKFSKIDISFRLLEVYDKSIVEGMVRALTGVPVHEVGSRDGVIALLKFREQFVSLGKAMEAFVAGALNHPELKHLADGLEGPQRQEAIGRGERVLAGNARRLLANIQEQYERLKEAMSV